MCWVTKNKNWIIERNIKNSIITRVIISVIANPAEKFPEIRTDKNAPIESKKVGVMNMIRIDIIKHVNPQSISIRAVKYFEFKSWFFVTGRVWVR